MKKKIIIEFSSLQLTLPSVKRRIYIFFTQICKQGILLYTQHLVVISVESVTHFSFLTSAQTLTLLLFSYKLLFTFNFGHFQQSLNSIFLVRMRHFNSYKVKYEHTESNFNYYIDREFSFKHQRFLQTIVIKQSIYISKCSKEFTFISVLILSRIKKIP